MSVNDYLAGSTTMSYRCNSGSFLFLFIHESDELMMKTMNPFQKEKKKRENRMFLESVYVKFFFRPKNQICRLIEYLM
jgi:hypothetical protein